MTTFQEAINKAAELTDHRITDNDRALAACKTKAERMAYHRKQLQGIVNGEGNNGTAAYKRKYPEAGPIQFEGYRVAYQPKPAGYDAELCGMVDLWFNNEVALAQTNRCDVARLNVRLGINLNPDKQFSLHLSAGRLRKVAEIFARHGARLDTRGPLSMSAVRSAVKAAKGRASPERQFGNVGCISGNQIVIGSQAFAIARHHGKECIRVTADRTTQRLYLSTVLQLLSGLEAGSPSTSSREPRIDREFVPRPMIDPARVESAPAGTGFPLKSPTSTDELDRALALPEPEAPVLVPELSDRIANLRGGSAERRAQEQARATELTAMKASRTDPLESV